MPRSCHYLKPNKNTEQPSHCIFLDCESDQKRVDAKTKVHKLTFGHACYTRQRAEGIWTEPGYVRFTTAAGLYAFIDRHAKPKRKLYVWCHNSNFDYPLTNILTYMALFGYRLKGAIIAGPPTIFTFERDGATVMFLDTLNIFRMSLAKLGKMLKLEKYEESDNKGRMKYDDKRCRRDVEIIVKAVQDWLHFIKQNDLGGFAPTLAGQAIRAYRHRFMPEQILIDIDERALKISRRAYFGGRTEAFRVGHIDGPLWFPDKKSQYPDMMHKHEFPRELHAVWNRPRHEQLIDLIETHCICAEVQLTTDEPVYPCILNGRTCFPIGTFTTHLSTPEIRYAIDHGHLDFCLQVAIYEKARLFVEFVEYFNAKRDEARRHADESGSTMFKNCLNHMSGKFGQKAAPWVDAGNVADLTAKSWVEYGLDRTENVVYRQFGGLLQVEGEPGEARDSHPAIIAHVTAYARVEMWEMIKLAGRKNVFYMDTDSLLVNRAGLDALRHLVDGDRLGSLAVNAKYASADIRGAKDYRLGRVTKIKGVKKNARRINADKFRQEQWSSLRGLVRKGSMTEPLTKTVTKNLKREYMKGFVMPSGVVAPYVLGENDPTPEFQVRRRARK